MFTLFAGAILAGLSLLLFSEGHPAVAALELFLSILNLGVFLRSVCS